MERDIPFLSHFLDEYCLVRSTSAIQKHIESGYYDSFPLTCAHSCLQHHRPLLKDGLLEETFSTTLLEIAPEAFFFTAALIIAEIGHPLR